MVYFQSNSDTESELSWDKSDISLECEKEKTFELSITTYDGQNSDTKETSITVNHINRAPELINTIPEGELNVLVGNSVIFELDASDPDNDSLSYNWNFGLLSAYEGSPIHKRVFMRTGKKTITATVSDGLTSIEKVWKLNVINPIATQEVLVTEDNQEGYISFTI